MDPDAPPTGWATGATIDVARATTRRPADEAAPRAGDLAGW